MKRAVLEKLLKTPDIYKGVYYDIFGHEGEIEFELGLGNNEKTLRAGCQIVIFGLGEPQTYRTVKGDEIELNISSLFERQDAKFHLTHISTDPKGVEGEKLFLSGAFEMHLRDADPYAPNVFFGSVDITGDPGIGGGIWMAWNGTESNR